MPLPARPKLDRAVDAGAGVPAGVGLVGVAGDDLDGVLALAQIFVAVHIEIGVAIGAEGRLLPVDADLRLAVDALELQHRVAPRFRGGEGKAFGIQVIEALKPAHVQPAHGLGAAPLPQHGVVRDGDGHALAGFVQMLDGPAVVEHMGNHMRTSC